MCGIFGAYSYKSPINDYRKPHRSLGTLAHRGPDYSGFFATDHVYLGHQRLAILDLSDSGCQPMSSLDGRFHIIFNGEIYNFSELKSLPHIRDYPFKSTSDTEVLLALWILEGTECLTRLNGMFSFAVLDSTTGLLSVVRDFCGIKPLFWASTADEFVFSSEAKALLAYIKTPNYPDSNALLDHLTYLWCPGPKTIDPSIHSLEPGHLITCKPGQKPYVCQWSTPYLSISNTYATKQETVLTALDLLRNAVHRQMISDVPVGAFLSGGLDSSAVVALAREINPNIQCFTISNPGSSDPGVADDLPYARRVAKHLSVPLTEVVVSSSDLEQDLRWMLRQLDAPVADPSPLNVFHICSAARRQGIKVMLSGAGGDDIFTGYRRHQALYAERLWNWWPKSFRRVSRVSTNRVAHISPFFRRLAKSFQLADESPDQRLIHYFAWGHPNLLRSLLSDRVKQHLIRYPSPDTLFRYLEKLPSDFTRLQKMLAIEQRYFLADHNLHYTDSMSMAAGVEVRVPFLDSDLVHFSWSLPDHYKQRGICGKWILKESLRQHLPRDIIYRPKTGFGAPLKRWLSHDLHPLLLETLDSSVLRRHDLFEPSSVNQLLSDHFNHRIDATYTIWSILCITLWWEMRPRC